jgi:hypothetical protein
MESVNASQPSFDFGTGGVFSAMTDSVFSRLAGGTPSDPKLIEGWLKSKMPGMTSDIERRHMLVRTLEEMGTTLPEGTDIMSVSMEQLEEAAAKVAASRGANGFKRPNRVVAEDGTVVHPGYLAIETRHLKSGIKEWINILFAGTRWGLTKKAPKSFAAEHVFVNALLDPAIIGEEVYQELTVPDARDTRKRVAKYPDFLFLTKYNESGDGGPMFTMLTEPDAVETFIGHVSGPQGPRSNLTRVEVVSGATIHVDMQVLRDEVQHHHWPIIFLAGQENGLGAMRSQGYGRFDIVRFERTGGKYQPMDWETIVKQVDADAILRDYQKTRDAKIAAGEIATEGTEGLVPLSNSDKAALSTSPKRSTKKAQVNGVS